VPHRFTETVMLANIKLEWDIFKTYEIKSNNDPSGSLTR